MTIPIRVQHFVGGKFLETDTPNERRNPSDLSEIVSLAPSDMGAVISEAVALAREAQPAWAAASPELRSDILYRACEILFERIDTYGELLSREEGKTLEEGKGEVGRAARIFRYFGGEALRAYGVALSSTRPSVDVETLREAVGVFGLITPWNFPIAIPVWKAAPALAYGNTVVLKPSELTPALANVIAEVLKEAGIPDGVFNVVYGGGEAGAALASHPEIDGVSFTGSVATGAKVSAAAIANQTRIQCEMGGKNALVILDDADMQTAVNVAMNGAFFSSGQKCTASSRLVVLDAIHDQFVEALSKRCSELKVGHALELGTNIGPLASKSQFSKVHDYLNIAKEEGAELIDSANLTTAFDGHYVTPKILLGTQQDTRINQEEIFGPVASIIKVTDYDQALHVANGTKFGLSAGIVTNSLKRARHFRRAAKAGLVMVNLPTAGVDYHVPFGGTRASNYGPREQGQNAIEFYTHVKTFYVQP